jgi:hypothetical protein
MMAQGGQAAEEEEESKGFSLSLLLIEKLK